MTRDELKKFLQLKKNIVICSHRNPDGDAIGASIAIYLLLSELGHDITLVFPSEYPKNFDYIPSIDKVKIYDIHPEEIDPKLDVADLIFALDFNGLDRIDKLGEKINSLDVPVVMIDHHIDPEPFYEYGISETAASSTSELVYEFMKQMGWEKKLTREIATSLLTGIITDTGSFKYNTRPNTFYVAGILQETGIDVKFIQDCIFNSMSVKQLRLLGHALNKRMEIMEEYRTGIIVLNKYDYKNFTIQRGDTEGIVNYLLMIKDIDLAAFITQQPQIVKISLRSKGDISVQEIARDHFNGGGHKNAAGGAQYGSLSKVIQKFKDIVPNYMQKTSNNE